MFPSRVYPQQQVTMPSSLANSGKRSPLAGDKKVTKSQPKLDFQQFKQQMLSR
jgi:hypothetical protein